MKKVKAHKNKSNFGFTSSQEKQRQATIRLIENTLQEMYQKHLPITKQSLADEAGLSRQALYAPYIKAYLAINPIFNLSVSEIAESSPPTVEQLQIELEKQKQKNLSLQKELNKTKKLLQESKQSYVELNREHQKLLGRYQTDIGRKIIHF